MSELSNVDSDQIRSTVRNLEGTITGITAQVRKFQDAIANLDRGWKSSVKADFMSRYARDQAAMQEMIEQMQEINTQLVEIANDFDKAESETAGRIAQLRR